MSNDRRDTLVDDDGTIDARRLIGSGSNDHAPVSREACRRLRVALAYGAEIGDHVRGVGYERATAHYHATGKCSHVHSVPPVAHTTGGHGTGGRWVIADE